MEWFGRATVEFTHSMTPLSLKKKDGTTTNISKIVKAAVPPCQLNPLLCNGHMQTMWTAVKEHGPQVYYRRKIFHVEEKTCAGSFAVDFVTEPHDDADESLPPRTAYYSEEKLAKIASDDTRPMLIALHGLSGGSHEIYLRQGIAPLVESGDWEVCVVNARGCANSKLTSGVLFNARATWDLRQVRGTILLGFKLSVNVPIISS